jgi:hypothetical protein
MLVYQRVIEFHVVSTILDVGFKNPATPTFAPFLGPCRNSLPRPRRTRLPRWDTAAPVARVARVTLSASAHVPWPGTRTWGLCGVAGGAP